MNKKELGKRLRAARERAGMTQTTAFRAMGWDTNGTLSNYENGNREPDIATLSRLVDLYGVSLSEFFSEEELAPVIVEGHVPVDFVRSLLKAMIQLAPEDQDAFLDKLRLG